MGILSFLKNISGRVVNNYPELRDASTWGDHIAAGLRLELKCCPVCSGNFKGHRFASFASTRIGKPYPPAIAFHDSVKDHDWDAVTKYQSGEKNPDNAEACAIECALGGVALLFVHTPFEPWDYTSIDFCEVLKPKEGQNLKNLIRDDLWMPLEASS